MTRLAIGDAAPAFEAVDTEGNSLRLGDLLETGPVILAFFPKASTSG